MGHIKVILYYLPAGVRSGLARLGFVSFAISAWINNTPIVALFSPIVREWARARGYAPSLFLIPLCYAVTLGGLCTSIGTSTNLGESTIASVVSV